MRVWILDPAAMTPYYDVSLAAALTEAGVEVRLLTSKFVYDREPLAGRYSEHFFFKPIGAGESLFRERPWLRRFARMAIYPFDLLRLWREFHRETPDILHIQWTWMPLFDAPFIRAMASGVPSVLTVHDVIPRAASFARISDMRPIYSSADILIVHAEQNRNEMITRFGLRAKKVRVVPHGPLFEEFKAPSQDEAREALGIESEGPVVLFFGLIKPYKGLVDLIEAVGRMRDDFPNLRLLIAGRPEGSPDRYLEAIVTRELEDVTIARFEFVPSDQVPIYFAAADVVCLPYRQASQSGVLLTAYRFGKPVVVTAVGGLPESVEDGRNGLVVPPADPVELAGALSRLLADRDKLRRFGNRSRELAEGRFGWRRAADLTIRIYREVIGNG